MPSNRKIRIEFTDNDGGNYNLSLSGSVTKEKITRIMELVDLLNPIEQDNPPFINNGTYFSKLYSLIDDSFPLSSFATNEVLEAYEDKYSSPIRLSTVSTYLQRLFEKGVLSRQRTPSGWMYRREKLIHK